MLSVAAVHDICCGGWRFHLLKKEIEMAFSDPDLSWMTLLDNERYCVYPADSEEEAKQYIKERLWNRMASQTQAAPPPTSLPPNVMRNSAQVLILRIIW